MAELVRVGGDDLYGPFYECSANFEHYNYLGLYNEIEIPGISVNSKRPLVPYLRRLIGRMTFNDTCNSANMPVDIPERINLLHPNGELGADIELITRENFDFFVRSYSDKSSHTRFGYYKNNNGCRRQIFLNGEKLEKMVKVRDIFPKARSLILEYIATPDAPTPDKFLDGSDIVDKWYIERDRKLVDEIYTGLKKEIGGLKVLKDNKDLLTWRVLSAMVSYIDYDDDELLPVYSSDIIEALEDDGCDCPCQFTGLERDLDGIKQDIWTKLLFLEEKGFLESENDEFTVNKKIIIPQDHPDQLCFDFYTPNY